MPRFSKSKKATALSSRRCGPSLEHLVFNLGGVAGAVRRIIHQSSQPLNLNQIYWRLQKQYPILQPARNQVEDVIQDLLALGRVEFKHNERGVRIYHWRNAPPVQPAQTPPKDLPPLKLKSVSTNQLQFEL